MFKINYTFLVLATALSSTVVHADPSSYTHMTGTKVIDIEKPNAAGVSHNMYRDFNVDNKGVILNNSADDLFHDKFGNIAKNDNLAAGGASVILNEVISKQASTLNGFIEVAGQKADIVIANPNGITCSGCSFINTQRAVLTTGKVNLTDSGAIKSYTVDKGRITINGAGMNADNALAAILASAISINGTIQAQNATINGGSFSFDNTSGTATSAGKSASLIQSLFPEYSIDISALGGIKANSISMTGNNLGFGVRNKGAIVASNTLNLLSNGLLINDGTISNEGMITQIASAGNLDNQGKISTGAIAVVNSLQTLTNSGELTGGGQLMLNAGVGIKNQQSVRSETLSISSQGYIKNTGLIAGDNITLTSNTVEQTKGARLETSKTLAIQSGSLNNAAEASITGADQVINGTTINNYGTISGSSIALTASGNLLNEGSIISSDNMHLSVQDQGELSNRGLIQTDGALTIDAKKVINGGYRCGWFNLQTCGVGSMVADSLVLNSSHKYVSDMGGQQKFKSTQTNTID